MTGQLPRAQSSAAFRSLWNEYALKGPEPGLRWTDPMQQNLLVELVLRWLDTNDPQFMDQALLYCHQEGLPVLPALLDHVAASVRLRRELKPAQKVVKETNKGRAFSIMANLEARNFSIERASEVAAAWTFDNCKKGLTACYLAREYPKTAWPKQADEIRERIPEWNEPETEARWLAIERECRELTEDEKGRHR